MKFLYLSLCAVTFFGLGCSRETRDWLTGVGHVKCPIYQQVNANVVNESGKNLDIGFCSSNSKYKLAPETKTIPDGESREYVTDVGQYDKEYEVHMNDSCDEAPNYRSSEYSENVGLQIPVLSASDASHYHTCFGAHAEFTNESGSIFQDQKVFKILPNAQPCPLGYSSLEDAGLSCN